MSPVLAAKPAKRAPVYFAIVLHDFEPERSDELDAKRGDAITVVAHSNREWFVAKPIGRLGRPGLIPVSFVELRDPATGNVITDVDSLIDHGQLPKVEDWKRAMAEYKENSISAGVSNGSGPKPDMPQPNPTYPPQPQAFSQTPVEQPSRTPPPPEPLPDGALISANVVSFHYEKSEFWFRIDASFQPYASPGQNQLPNARRLVLFRIYDDFYNLQVTLLNRFPREAGREPPHPRILPFMPGPTDTVDHQLAANRRVELDDYMHALCDLNLSGHIYILDTPFVREFLTPKPGDVETEVAPMVRELDAILQGDAALREGGSGGDYIDPFAGSADGHAELLDIVGNMPLVQGTDVHGRGYGNYPEYQNADPGPYEHYDHQPNVDPFADRREWTHPAPAFQRAESPYTTSSRTESPQVGMIKIKVFDHASDDLVSIRVQPNISLGEFMDKVQSRLGGISILQYRDSSTGGMVEISDDQDLKFWIDTAQKYMLYAN